MRRVVRKSQFMMVIMLSVIALLFAAFSTHILDILYARKYSDYGLLMSLLAFRLVATGIVVPQNTAFLILERPQFHFLINTVGVVFTLTFGLAFVLSWGAIGAGLGFLLAGVASVVSSCFFYRRAVFGQH